MALCGPFCIGLISRKLCKFLLMFFIGFTLLIILLLFPLWITFSIFMHSFWFYFHPVSLLSVVCKVFEKLVNNRIIDFLEKYGVFLISSMGLGLLNQLQIFWQLYLIELLGLLTEIGMLVTNLSFMEFQVRYLVLFLLFSVIDSFEWFWMGSLCKNIQLTRKEKLGTCSCCVPAVHLK